MSRRDELVKEGSKLGNEKLGNNLVHNVTQTNGLEMVNECRVSNLWNEHNQRTFYLFTHRAFLEEGGHCLDYIVSHGRPYFLVK